MSVKWKPAALHKHPVVEDFLIGKVLAHPIVDKESGEILAHANDEITDEILKKLVAAGVETIKTIYTNDLDQGPYISQTLRIDETQDQLDAQVAIYRMMRPGEPPTEDAVRTLFNGLFFAEERYDLSAVGRMKFNRRVGREELTGASTMSNEDIVAVIRILVDLRNGRGEIDDIDHLGNRRVRSVGRTGGEPVPRRAGAGRAGGQGASVPGRVREPDAARPDQRQAGVGGGARVLRLLAAVAVHGPDQPAVRDHPQAPGLGVGAGRAHARAGGLRGARRAPDPLRPRVPDRDAGGSEHRPDQLARAVRAHQRVRVPGDAVPAAWTAGASPTRSRSCRPSTRAST